jgi:hydroxymethylbilane synthase
MSRTLVIGTRGSKLALQQTEIIVSLLHAARPDITLDVRTISTHGDRTSAPLSEIGGLGAFTKAIEDALIARQIDIAVHSLKDLPTEVARGLTIAATPVRADARDALITRKGARLVDLPPGARVGTGAGRRAVQVREMRPDLLPCEIRGNVDTRVRKVDEGEYDAAVLAVAGLERLGFASRASQVFEIREILPAVGQGALAVEVRADDEAALSAARAIDDPLTHVAVDAERAFLRRLGGGCRLPVGAYATVERGSLSVRGMIASEDGRIFRGARRGGADAPELAGAALADELLARGAARFIEAT